MGMAVGILGDRTVPCQRQGDAKGFFDDLAQFAGCMSLVAEGPPLSDVLAAWSGKFEYALVEEMLRRLGVSGANGAGAGRVMAPGVLARELPQLLVVLQIGAGYLFAVKYA